MRATPGIRLTRLSNGDLEANVLAALGQAHGYQISSARGELRYEARDNLLELCPNLLAISSQGAGFDTVDVDACTRRGIIVVNQGGLGSQPVAEHVVASMLVLSKRLVEADRAMRRDRKWNRLAFKGRDVDGKTVGIVGLGAIGRRVAQLCRNAFGMRVLACDPYLPDPEFGKRHAEKATFDQLLAESDFVAVHVPLNAETRGMLGAREFSQMKPGAIFVINARGGIVDERALFDALAARRLAGAAIDVWAEEPPPLDHPLLGLDNVLLSPHIAGLTDEAYYAMAEGAARQWTAIFRGEYPPRLQNPEAWPVYAERFARAFGKPPMDRCP
jgi:D-3-phosphoglycerate dehydrogenase